ncbi:MAG TPA: glycosyltransferase, partial [Halieaceae bacterium]|nr:glycosyltransferase [Halieaceae bacterium]
MPVTVELSILVPVFNEEESIHYFFQRVDPIVKELVGSHEYVLVNDGSRDRTVSILKAMAEERSDLTVINLSRNFGKDVALSAGFDYSRGQAVVPMDVDLQDPPELLEEMMAKYREGYDMVIAVRKSRGSDSWFKRMSASWFYALIGR